MAYTEAHKRAWRKHRAKPEVKKKLAEYQRQRYKDNRIKEMERVTRYRRREKIKVNAYNRMYKKFGRKVNWPK